MEKQREQQPYCPEDEIDLLDLWRVLVRHWKVICAFTGLSILGAVAYILLTPPVYEVQVAVKPPESKYVETLNIPGISQTSCADIFANFTEKLKSSSLRQQLIDESPQFSSLRGNVPSIKEGAKNETGSVVVSLQGKDPKLVSGWVNGFILLAERRTIGDFFDGIEIKIANQKKEIENQLQIGRDFANQRRLDRIALLEDQIAIARASKIFDRQLSGYSVAEGQSSGATVDILQGPMYLRGVKELVAEKEALERRGNNEPFIAGFRDKQQSLAQLDAGLKQLQAARAGAHAVTVDQPTVQYRSPMRLALVLTLSTVVGGIMGVFAAFVINFVQQQKAKIKGSEASTGSESLMSNPNNS
jgi:LPS O-antigen subunit length determinant protein (WzzB/FepE family)